MAQGLWEGLRRFLFGATPRHGGEARVLAWRLVKTIEENGLLRLSDEELMDVVDHCLTIKQLRVPLRGNVRFLGSVAAQFHKRRSLSPKQRQGVLNVLQRAYPHNLVAELSRFTR